MLFPFEKRGNQTIAHALKLLAMIIPIPRPTLFSGKGSTIELCRAIAQMDFKKVLIVTDRTLVRIGIAKPIVTALQESGVDCHIYEGVEPDPRYDHVLAGLAEYKERRCQAVLALGGGSVIDVAKVIAAMATNKKRIEKLTGYLKVRQYPAALFAIPTTAGTGSEVTVAAVITNPETHQKMQFIDPKLVPMKAALDGSLMVGLPAHITAMTGMDALTHAIEAFISVNATADTDAHAIAAVRLIMQNLLEVYRDGSLLDARENMAMASFYAGIAFTKASVGYVHAISHTLSAFYETPHGLGNAVVLPHVLEYSVDKIAGRLAKLARVTDLSKGDDSDEQAALAFINHIRYMNQQMEIPEKLGTLKGNDIPAIAKAALKEAHHNYPVPKFMNQKQCETVLGLI